MPGIETGDATPVSEVMRPTLMESAVTPGALAVLPLGTVLAAAELGVVDDPAPDVVVDPASELGLVELEHATASSPRSAHPTKER
jgi:hypothetical protein